MRHPHFAPRVALAPFAISLLSTVVACSSAREEAAWLGMTSAGPSGAAGDDGGETAELDGGDTFQATLADDDQGDDGPPDDGTTGGADSTDDTGHGDGDPSGDDGGVDCPANCYCEPIDADAALDDVEDGYSPQAWSDTIFEVLGRRWPAGRDLLLDQAGDPYFGAFTDTSSFASLMDGLMTEAHEGTHGWDYGNATVDEFAYFLRADLQFFPPKLHGFDRGEIYGMVDTGGYDIYRDLYFSGTQGTYGFYELLDEMNCYINGMAAMGVVGEYIPYGVSGRDGAVAFMYYLELYLKLARTQYPQVYAEIQSDPDYVEMIEVQWLRLHFLLMNAGDLHPNIGLYDEEYEALMYAPENQGEIEMLIGKELEASNCLP